MICWVWKGIHTYSNIYLLHVLVLCLEELECPFQVSNNLAGACIHKPLRLYRLQVVEKIN